MIYHDIEQNTDEWLDLRAGKLTGSAASKAMAHYGKSFGEPAKKAAVTIAVEQLTGKRAMNNGYSNEHMERGHEQEPLARAAYEDETFTDVANGGFFELGHLGCSPDGLVGDNGLIEIKSVIDSVHYNNIKRGNVDPAYKWQIYFNLLITNREWIDFVSYCADFPIGKKLCIYRTHREDCQKEFDMLDERLTQFIELVETIKNDITEADNG